MTSSKILSKPLSDCQKLMRDRREKLRSVYIASVIEFRNELVDIQESLQDQNLPSENWSSITVTEDRFNQMIQMIAQMQHVLIGQQQI